MSATAQLSVATGRKPIFSYSASTLVAVSSHFSSTDLRGAEDCTGYYCSERLRKIFA